MKRMPVFVLLCPLLWLSGYVMGGGDKWAAYKIYLSEAYVNQTISIYNDVFSTVGKIVGSDIKSSDLAGHSADLGDLLPVFIEHIENIFLANSHFKDINFKECSPAKLDSSSRLLKRLSSEINSCSIAHDCGKMDSEFEIFKLVFIDFNDAFSVCGREMQDSVVARSGEIGDRLNLPQ